MNTENIKYVHNEITFFVPNCRSFVNKKSCELRKFAEKNGFICEFSDAPFGGRWVKLSLLLNDSKSRTFSKIIKDSENCCAKCK